jgi:hypothetical protein
VTGGERLLPEGYDEAALDRCRDLFFGALEQPDRVSITITSEFTRVVRETVEDKAYADAYEQDRPMAFAVAKTIERSDGTIHLIVFADLFLEGHPFGDPETTFAHEALHVNISERGETLSDLRLRLAGGHLPVHESLVAAAGVAAEEYRVERALWAQGWRSESGHMAGIDRLSRIFYNEVRAACRRYQDNLDVFAVAKATLEAFHALVTSSGYIAAELAESGQDPFELELDMEDDLDERVLGAEWREVLVQLQRLPAADMPLPRDQLDAHALKIAAGLRTWLESIGFKIEQVDPDTSNFKILAPWQWSLPGFQLDEA